MKILYAASEAAPFAKSGGLADVAGALPKALVRDGIDARVVMPLYGDLKFKDTLTYVTNFSVPVGWRSQYCGLFKAERDGVVYYFIDNEYYFKRSGLYGFYDDGERFAFFSRAILEMLFYTDFEPDIINCNDWQTALTPVYLNLYYRHLDKFSRIKTVFTIHNIAYQGKYGLDILEDTCGIGARDAHVVEYDGCANFMKGAIECADKVTTVSPTYAQEILDPWFSHGLDGLLRQKQYKLCGILNGIDVDVFNPATDPDIAKNYDAETFQDGKAACKAYLQDEFGLHKDGSPVMAMVTRLVGHKGVDLVQAIAEGLLQQGIELVVLGSGEAQYEINHVVTAFVDAEKNIKCKTNQLYNTIPQDEAELIMINLKKVLSGSIGKNLLEYSFPKDAYLEGGAQPFMYETLQSKLLDEEKVDNFLNAIVEKVEYVSTYTIFAAHCTYSVLRKNKMDEFEDEADTDYNFIVTALCPVNLRIDGLVYDEQDNSIAKKESCDRIVELPSDGFLFPLFNDRAPDINGVLYYTKNAKKPNTSVVEELLGCEFSMTCQNEKETFKDILTSVVGDELDYDLITTVNDKISTFVDQNAHETEIPTIDEHTSSEYQNTTGSPAASPKASR